MVGVKISFVTICAVLKAVYWSHPNVFCRYVQLFHGLNFLPFTLSSPSPSFPSLYHVALVFIRFSEKTEFLIYDSYISLWRYCDKIDGFFGFCYSRCVNSFIWHQHFLWETDLPLNILYISHEDVGYFICTNSSNVKLDCPLLIIFIFLIIFSGTAFFNG